MVGEVVGLLLGGNDIQTLKDGVEKLGAKLDTVVDAIADLRVLVAGEYVKKTDFNEHKKQEEDWIVRVYDKIEEHKKEESAIRWKLAGFTVTITTLSLTVSRWIYDFLKGGNYPGS